MIAPLRGGAEVDSGVHRHLGDHDPGGIQLELYPIRLAQASAEENIPTQIDDLRIHAAGADSAD